MKLHNAAYAIWAASPILVHQYLGINILYFTGSVLTLENQTFGKKTNWKIPAVQCAHADHAA